MCGRRYVGVGVRVRVSVSLSLSLSVRVEGKLPVGHSRRPRRHRSACRRSRRRLSHRQSRRSSCCRPSRHCPTSRTGRRPSAGEGEGVRMGVRKRHVGEGEVEGEGDGEGGSESKVTSHRAFRRAVARGVYEEAPPRSRRAIGWLNSSGARTQHES